MTAAEVLTGVVRLVCLFVIAGTVGLAIREAKAAHARGIARVHRRQSWPPRPARDIRGRL